MWSSTSPIPENPVLPGVAVELSLKRAPTCPVTAPVGTLKV